MEAQITVAEFRKHLGDYAHRVSVHGETYVVARYGRPIFRISPADYERPGPTHPEWEFNAVDPKGDPHA